MLPSIRPKKISVVTFGCKLNQYESEAILAQFRAAGYIEADAPENADVCVVNTCSVTATAERKARGVLRSLHRRNPSARLIAAGCMAERVPGTLAGIEGMNIVLGNREKEHILDFVDSGTSDSNPSIHVGETSDAQNFLRPLPLGGTLGRTRTFLKIQDGCSQKCTYCIIPKLRGQGRSLKIADVVHEIERLCDCGYHEIVLTGIALGTYGSDIGLSDGLADLLDKVRAIKNLRRLRLGSVEPWAISDRLLGLIADSDNICPHLHIPLQSVEDSVLHRMNRRYTVKQIDGIFASAFRRRNDWGFGSDIIVGFPGETAESFESTMRVLADSPLAYLHVFPYSSRPGTPAAKLPDHVPAPEKQRRVRMLHDFDARIRQRFRTQYIGMRQSVLFERRYVDGLLAGHARNYLDVYVDAPQDMAGEERTITITRIHPAGVVGELSNEG